jgi:sugar phosphate isomerase/epimerase
MEYGCCTTIDNYELLVKNGYDRIILPAAELMDMEAATFERLRGTLSDGPVKCLALNSFCTPELVLCGDGYNGGAVETYTRALADRAARIGVRYIGVGAPKSRSIPPKFPRSTAVSQLEQSLGVMCRACAEYGIEVLLEAVCDLECNFITTTDEASGLVGELGRPNLGLVFDTYHAFMMGEDDGPLRRAMKHVRLVHTAQNIGGRRHYLRQANMEEYRIYFQALLEGGYDGEVSVEAFFDEPASQLGDTLVIMKTLCSPGERQRRF